MKLTRYQPEIHGDDFIGWVAHPKGEWVKAADVDALCDSLKRVALPWTTKKPTVPGFYFWRDKALVLSGDRKAIELTAKDISEIHLFGDTCEWAGPLPLPMDEGGK